MITAVVVVLLSAGLLPCFGSLDVCRSVLHQRSGDIYHNTWEDGQRNCSWTFADSKIKPNAILVLKFVHMRYIRGPGLMLPDGSSAEGQVGRHLYTDKSKLPWCGVYVSSTLSDMTPSCESLATAYCRNSIHVSQSWPPVLQVTGKNLIFLASYSYFDCNEASVISATSDVVSCTKTEFSLIGVITILFLAVVVLATLLYKSRKNSTKKYHVSDRSEPVYDLVRFYRRTFGKSNAKKAKQGLIVREALGSNTETDQEMVTMSTKHFNTIDGEPTYCKPTCCAALQCDVHRVCEPGDREMEPETSSSTRLYVNSLENENVYLEPTTVKSLTSKNSLCKKV